MKQSRRGVKSWSALVGVLMLVLASPVAWAAGLSQPLGPDEVVAYARAHRAEIRASAAKAEALAHLPKVVSALADPMIMTRIDHLPFSGIGINVSLMVQEEFPMSGILGDRKRAAQAEARAATAEARTVELDVEYQALAAYLMLAELQRMAAIFDEQIAVAKQVASATEIELSVGQAVAADVIRAALEVARLEGERSAIDGDIASASAMLDAALALPAGGSSHNCAFTAPDREPAPLADLLAQARKRRPEISAMHERVSKAYAEVDVMDSMYRPMGIAQIGTAYTMSDGPGLMFGFGISIPMWRGKLDAGKAEAKSMAVMASADESAMRTMVDGDVSSARAEVLAARTRYSVAHDKLVPLAKAAVSLSLDSYASGQLPLVSVLDSVRALRESRMSEVVAEVKVAAAWARLGRSVGVVKLGAP